jgi:hypothetical protein
LYRSAGHAILRTQGPAGLTSVLVFGDYGGYHGHLDKLSFVLFAYGEELGVDPGRSQAYRLPVQRHWYKATVAHNTVLIDRASQRGTAGVLELFGHSPGYAAAAASCDTAYSATVHRRLLAQTPEYLLIVDEVHAGRRRRCDWVYHNRGLGIECAAALQPTDLGSQFTGAEYIRDAKTGVANEPVLITFPGKTVTTYLTVTGEPDTSVITGHGVGTAMTDRVPLVMIARSGKTTRFVAVLEPLPAGTAPSVCGVRSAAENETLTVTVEKRERGQDVIRLQPGPRLEMMCGGKTVLVTESAVATPPPRGTGTAPVPAAR